MYFDLEDYRPDITPVERAISWREGVLISIIVHLAVILLLVLAPRWIPPAEETASQREVALRDDRERPRFVFVDPREDPIAPAPPERAELSDEDRVARAPERALVPENPLPFSRGNTPERVDEADQQAARGEPSAETSIGEQAETAPLEGGNDLPWPEEPTAQPLPDSRQARNDTALRAPAGGSLGDALRDLGRYLQGEQFDNPQGSAGSFGPAIQFDTKGVEFGPWIRRFIAQVKGNWLIPLAAMSMGGHVVLTFFVDKNGMITDLAIAEPCPIEAFNTAAYGALAASNPTQPLPPEYPVDRAFFTVTFFYNEQPR